MNLMNAPPEIFEFEEFRVDSLKRQLFRSNGEVITLPPKAFDTLLHLVKHPGQLLRKNDLMEAVWVDVAVEENNLSQSISAIRRALGERGGDHRFIVTVSGHGYKFVAPVRELASDKHDGLPESDLANDELQRHDPASIDEPLHRRAPSWTWSRNQSWLLGTGVVTIAGFLLLGYFLRPRDAGLSPTIRTIAVLPFKPLFEPDRNEALELGMADTLIAKLSGNEDLAVRPLESVRRANSSGKDPLAIGRDLGVEAVVDGSIQTGNDRIRVTARLTRTSDGKQLWSGQFEEKLNDIFALQDAISQRVAAALRTKLKRSGRQQTQNVDAYKMYVTGRLYASRLTLDDTEKAIAAYNEAIALDPNYALPFVGLSRAYRTFTLTSDVPSGEAMPEAKAAALRALELDEIEPEAHTALGLIAFHYDWDWAAAERHA